MRLASRLFLACLVLLPFSAARSQRFPLPAGAADSLLALRITGLDTTAFPDIAMKVKLFTGQRVVRDTSFSTIVVSENGTIQNAQVTCPVRPFSAVLVLDKSLSMAFYPNSQDRDPDSTRWNTAKGALHSFINQLNPIDQCALVSFASTPKVEVGLSKDKTLLNNLLEGITLKSGTGIWLAVQSAITILSPRPEAKAIILLTDGEDNSSGSTTMTKVAIAAKKAGIRIFAVGLAEDASRAVLTALADSTGGKYFFSATGADLADIYYEITAQLVDDCTLTYTTSEFCTDGTRRDVHLFGVYKSETVTADTFYTAPNSIPDIRFTLPVQSIFAPGNDISILLSASDSLRSGQPLSFSTDISYPSNVVTYAGFSTTGFALAGVNVSVIDNNGVLAINVDTSYVAGSGAIMMELLFKAKVLSSASAARFAFSGTAFKRTCPYRVQTENSEFYVDGLCEKLIQPSGANFLRQNYPNPFSASTTVTIDATALNEHERGHARLRVLDALGNEVADLHNGALPKGLLTLTWNAGTLPSGVYTVELQSGATRVQRLAVKLR